MARLVEVPGLEEVAADHSGTLLRLRAVHPAAIAAVRATLAALGHVTEELTAEEERTLLASGVEWYARERIGELSREEAAVLAEEAILTFARETPLDPSESARLRSYAEDEFVSSLTAGGPDPAGRLEQALPRIVERAATFLEEKRAARLAQTLRSWSVARGFRQPYF